MAIFLFGIWLGIAGPIGQIGDAERTGFVKFLFDWQQLISGVLALTAAAFAAWLRIPTKSPGCTDMKSPGDSETMSPTFPI
jgi:ABC-type dipeptide/oligopeptide/nickel transport system permease component